MAAGGPLPAGEVNLFRIYVTYRSFGLLERHSTSALWMAFGFFAYVFLTADPSKKRTAFGFTATALLIAQNFTSLVAFFFVTALLYRRSIRIKSFVLPVLAITPVLFLLNDRVTNFLRIGSQLLYSKVLQATAFQAGEGGYSYLSEVSGQLRLFGREMFQRPQELVLGYGLGSTPLTGGDVGFTDAMIRLGIPLWIWVTWNIVSLLRTAKKATRSGPARPWKEHQARLVIAAAAILASTWLMDLHYSAWIYKSIWPILFFAMALARRVDRQPAPLMPNSNTEDALTMRSSA